MDVKGRAHWIAMLYYHAELTILRKAARDLARHNGLLSTTIRKARQFAEFEESARRILDEAHAQVVRELLELVQEAVQTGTRLAVTDLQALGYPATVMPAQRAIIELIAGDLVESLSPAPTRALRAISDVYQEVQALGSANVATGVTTRLGASQQMFDDLIRRGVTGFIDKAGRNWHLDSYAEMAIRTGAMNAQIESRMSTYADNGMDLVYVSDSPNECDLCRPWEMEILTLRGEPGKRVVQSVTGGAPVTVTVAGTLEDARAAGLLHPNCTHNITAYLPGATVDDYPKRDDKVLYELEQEQRYIERQIRHWKRREAAAIDTLAKHNARWKIVEWEDQLKYHITRHPGLRRRSERLNPFTAQ